MSSMIESAGDAARRSISRWRGRSSRGVYDFHDGMSAVVLESGPAELSAPPSDAHILSMYASTEARHCHWRDGKLVHDGRVRPRAINIIPAGVAPRAVVSHSVQALQVFIPHSTLIRAAEQAYSARVASALEVVDLRFSRDEPFEMVASALFDSVIAGVPSDSVWLDSLGAAVIARMIECWSNASDLARTHAQRHVGGLTMRQVANVKRFVHANVDRKLSLQDMAGQLGLSIYHFARSFKTTVGIPPYAYVAKARLEKARLLMHEGERHLPTIAAQVGHDDVMYFSRAFRRHFGLTPAQYMKTLRT